MTILNLIRVRVPFSVFFWRMQVSRIKRRKRDIISFYVVTPKDLRRKRKIFWEGELEGLSTTGAWIYFGGYLLETCSSTQQIVALSTTGSEYISITKGAAHALEVLSAMVECGLSFNVVCETDASAGRAMATRRGVGRVRHLDARLSWLQQLCVEGVVQVRARLGEHNEADLGTRMVDLSAIIVAAAVVGRRRDGIAIPAWRTQRGRPGVEDGQCDFASERNTPSTTTELHLMDGGSEFPRGCRGSKRLSCVNLEREEHIRDLQTLVELV